MNQEHNTVRGWPSYRRPAGRALCLLGGAVRGIVEKLPVNWPPARWLVIPVARTARLIVPG